MAQPTRRALHAALMRPKTAHDLLQQFGYIEGVAKMMRAMAEKGMEIKAARVWDDGVRYVYWATAGEDAYTLRRLRRKFGIDVSQGEVV